MKLTLLWLPRDECLSEVCRSEWPPEYLQGVHVGIFVSWGAGVEVDIERAGRENVYLCVREFCDANVYQ